MPDRTILIDCGTAVFGALRALGPPEQIDDIVISHLHFDHWIDLIPFRYYLEYETQSERAPRLHLPPGSLEKLERITGEIDGAPGFFGESFRVLEYDPVAGLRLEQLRVDFQRTRHPIDTYAMKFSIGAGSLVYSADTGWLDELVEFGRAADVFLCEAAFADTPGNPAVHLTGAEAGRLASLSEVGQLLLTHVAQARAESAVMSARGEYSGPIVHAAAGRSFAL